MSLTSTDQTEASSTPTHENSVPATGPPHAYHLEHTESSPEIIARLEWLDDLIFAAIEGDAVALDHASTAWRYSLEELGAPALEESRLQYLRHARTVWYALREQPNHPPHKIFAAIEIISLLAGKASGYGAITL